MSDPVEAHTDPFWDGLEAGRVLVQRCEDCGEAYFPPAPVCPRCHSGAVAWTETDGEGELYAFTRQHRTAPGVDAPVVLGVVELATGPRLLARLDADYETLAVGDPVVVEPCAYEGGVDRGRLEGRPFFVARPTGD